MSDTELVCGSVSDAGCFYGLMSDTGLPFETLSVTGRFYGK